MSQFTEGTGTCCRAQHLLHAYMCRPGARGTTDVRPTLMAMGGYTPVGNTLPLPRTCGLRRILGKELRW